MDCGGFSTATLQLNARSNPLDHAPTDIPYSDSKAGKKARKKQAERTIMAKVAAIEEQAEYGMGVLEALGE